MKTYGTYEINGDNATFEDNNGSILNIKTRHVNDGDYISIDEAQKLAFWALKNKNPNAIALLEKINEVRMQYKCKRK